MRYDFSKPIFKNGMVTFAEKKPDLVYEFRLEAWRHRYELKSDMILYSQDRTRIARVQNYGHMLLVTMINTRKIKKLYNKIDIEQFFRNINENTEFNRKANMTLTEAKQILRKNGFICESREKFSTVSWLNKFYMEMRRAAEANPVIGNSTSIGEIWAKTGKAYRIIVPVENGDSTKWYGVLIRPDADGEIVTFVYEDTMSTNDTEILSGDVTEGVYTNTYDSTDWETIFNDAADAIMELNNG